MGKIGRTALTATRRALLLFAYLATRVSFLAGAVVVLVLGRASDLPWAGPVFIAAQLAIVALVRYGIDSWSKWADEYVLWLDAGDAHAWAAWHREYVSWSTEHRARGFGTKPAVFSPDGRVRTLCDVDRLAS
jgi:hypothetical protein